MRFVDPLQFWEIFSAAMNENPPPENEIKAVLPSFKHLGIVLGKQWKRAEVNPLILAQMKIASQEIGPLLNNALGIAGTINHGWVIPPPNVENAGTDYPSRAIVAVFGLTANTPGEAISTRASSTATPMY